MKTTFKSLMVLAAIVTAIITSSCTGTLENGSVVDINLNPGDSQEPFTAVVETFCGTKTTFGALESSAYTLLWTSGDKISISDGTSDAVYTTSNSDTTSASFTWTSGKLSNSASAYTSFYPSTITRTNMTLPTEQEYVENDVREFPMYALSSNRNLQFKNLCGIVRFDITDGDESADYSVSAIHLSCTGKGLSGQFTVGEDYAAVVSAESGVTLKCSTAQALGDDARSFNIIVPAGNYENLKAVIDFSDGTSRTYQADGTVNVKRSSIVRYGVTIKASELSGSLELIPIEDGDVEFTER